MKPFPEHVRDLTPSFITSPYSTLGSSLIQFPRFKIYYHYSCIITRQWIYILYPPNARQADSSNKNFIQRIFIENDPSKGGSREVECVRLGTYMILRSQRGDCGKEDWINQIRWLVKTWTHSSGRSSRMNSNTRLMDPGLDWPFQEFPPISHAMLHPSQILGQGFCMISGLFPSWSIHDYRQKSTVQSPESSKIVQKNTLKLTS